MLRRITNLALQAAVMTAITLALLEGVVAFSLHNPRRSLVPMPLLRYLHERFDRHTIQVMPDCAMFDAYVTYTLKPGGCTFANREFSNEYRINRLGVRDDEASLIAPDTIVLGDSLAMGWGVEQDEAFPAVFERLSGRKTLNAGISSFGTVRALRFLQRTDRSGLRTVVIQYSDNDFGENRQFLSDPQFRTLTREEYERTVADHQQALSYVPGKYALNVLVQFQSLVRSRLPGSGVQAAGLDLPVSEQVEAFAGVLERFKADLQPYQLVVVTLDAEFARALRQHLAGLPGAWLAAALVLDASGVARIPGAFYVLDDHPTAIGQYAIGESLVRLVQSSR